MRVALIANPVSGRREGLRCAERALEVFTSAGWTVDLQPTFAPGHATELAREAAASGVDLVVIAGGDGTLSQAATGLSGTGVPLGALPGGTGNDFARALGLPLDARQAAHALLEGRPVEVDLLQLDGGPRRALNLLGTGFDARVCDRINRRSRRLGGSAAYFVALAQELWQYSATHMRITVDDECWEGDALLVAVANGVSYGAGMKIAPNARVDDGLLDVVLVQYIPRLEFIRTFPKVLKGTHITHPAIRCWRGVHAELHTQRPGPVIVDGDLTAETPLQVDIAPDRCLVWAPPVR